MSTKSELWWKEYQNTQGIPSSHRAQPSSTVSQFFYPKISDYYKRPSQINVVDLGCGRGRNSFFFAEKGFKVWSIDLVFENIHYIQKNSTKRNLSIHPMCQDVSSSLPFDDNSMDIVIDLFCYKHLTDEKERALYRSELFRYLKKGGYYLLSLAGKDDGYYGQFLSNDAQSRFIIDPAVGIGSILFDPADVEQEFNQFTIQDSQTVRKDGLMHGHQYRRVTHAFIMQKID